MYKLHANTKVFEIKQSCSLYILELNPLSVVGLAKIFSQSVGCRFVWLTVSFALQKLLSFSRSHILNAILCVCAIVVIFRKWSPVPVQSTLLPTFSSMRFIVVAFTLRSLIHWNLSFLCANIYGPICHCWVYNQKTLSHTTRTCAQLCS